jgi:hypothetical protein
MLCEAARKKNENTRLGFATSISISERCSLFRRRGLQLPQTKKMVGPESQQTDRSSFNGTAPIYITMLPVARVGSACRIACAIAVLRFRSLIFAHCKSSSK